jgi:molybdopterin molybdotransferase
MEFFQYLPLGEARARVAAGLAGIITGRETVDLPDALGRVAAADIAAGEDLPPFGRSSVDGFAVRSADTFGASEAVPAMLAVVGEVAMGNEAPDAVRPGQAVAIPTGGMLPAGADAVVMLEHTDRPDDTTLLVLRVAAPGENVVARGEDIAAGAVIVARGTRLAPQHIGILAACGHSRVPVREKPAVAVISSGDELVGIDQAPAGGRIRDINSHALGAMLAAAGCAVTRLGIVRDDYDDFLAILKKAVAASRLVVISGGSSVGARDYTVKAIGSLGAPGVLIHGIAVKPGRPTVFGMVGQVPVFGLPGHPVAAMTICGQLVRPAIRSLLGEAAAQPYSVPAVVTRSVASAPGRDDFVNVRLVRSQGAYTADPILGKSGLISTIAQADGIVHIPADKSGLYSGETVEVLLINFAQ